MGVEGESGPPASCSTQSEMRPLIGQNNILIQPSDWLLSLTSGRGIELPHSAVSDVDQVVLAAPEPVIAETSEMTQLSTLLQTISIPFI